MGEPGGPLGTVRLAATTLYVTDLDDAIAWYGEKLGLEPMMSGADADRYSSYLVGGSIIVLEPVEAAAEAAPPGSESTTINLLVERDPATVREELIARGVSCGPLLPSPNFLSFLVRDLDGNRFYVSRAGTQAAREVLEETAAATAPTPTAAAGPAATKRRSRGEQSAT